MLKKARTCAMAFLATAHLGACTLASDPNRIPASYVPPELYEKHTCEELAKHLVELGYRIQDLHAYLAERRRTDQWQLGFSWFYGLSGLFIDGDGPEAEQYRHLQGDFEAARVQAVKKDCGFEAPTRNEIFLKAKASLHVTKPDQVPARPAHGAQNRGRSQRRGRASWSTAPRSAQRRARS